MQTIDRLRRRVCEATNRMDGQAEARRAVAARIDRIRERLETVAANVTEQAPSSGAAAENKELKAMVLSLLRTIEGLADPQAAMPIEPTAHTLTTLRHRTAGAIASARVMTGGSAGAAVGQRQPVTAGASTLLRDMLREMTEDPLSGRTPR